MRVDVFGALPAHYVTWEKPTGRPGAGGTKEMPYCVRIKQLLWRKVFSLPGLATLPAQS